MQTANSAIFIASVFSVNSEGTTSVVNDSSHFPGPVVQSTVSSMSSLRGQFIKSLSALC